MTGAVSQRDDHTAETLIDGRDAVERASARAFIPRSMLLAMMKSLGTMTR